MSISRASISRFAVTLARLLTIMVIGGHVSDIVSEKGRVLASPRRILVLGGEFARVATSTTNPESRFALTFSILEHRP